MNSTTQDAESATPEPRRIAILGATGSIGKATVDVLSKLNAGQGEQSWHLWAASGHRQVEQLVEMVADCRPKPQRLIVSDPAANTAAAKNTNIDLQVGADALVEAARAEPVDTVVAGIVGRAGVESTLAAIEADKRVALANKETLVVAGSIVEQMMETCDAEILPVDSEHSAIFQCIESSASPPKKLILTASGGPFRTWTLEQMRDAGPESALDHPTWEMGRKITIDSATMMNKALEIVEARWLFGLPSDAIEVVVHPQSIIHSMVEFNDGSVISQMSPPDMRMPIQLALTYPDRLPCPAPTLDRSRIWELTMEPADPERFPALDLGFEVAAAGGTAGAVLNAANEEAVGLFLDGQIRFTDIVTGCRDVLENHDFEPHPTLERLLELDQFARNELRSRFKIV